MDLRQTALELRRNIIKMNCVSGAGHITSSCSCLEILISLYLSESKMRFHPDDPLWEDRDYFVLSKGHAAMAYYAVLSKAGFIPEDELWTFCAIGTRLGGHVSTKVPGVETASGSLGHGLPFATGLALGAKMKGTEQRVYCVTGDGELQEGSIWEAAMSIAHFKLTNLIWIVDKNNLQIAGHTDDVISLGSLVDKLSSFGFDVTEINGHCFDDLESIFATASNKPRVIIAHTVKGYGIPSIEGRADWHGRKPNREELLIILRELGMEQESLRV